MPNPPQVPTTLVEVDSGVEISKGGTTKDGAEAWDRQATIGVALSFP